MRIVMIIVLLALWLVTPGWTDNGLKLSEANFGESPIPEEEILNMIRSLNPQQAARIALATGFKEGAKDVGHGIKEGSKKVGQGFKELGKEFKEGGQEVGRDFKKAGQEAGQEAKKKGRSVGEWFRDAGTKTGDGFREFGRSIRKFFTGNR